MTPQSYRNFQCAPSLKTYFSLFQFVYFSDSLCLTQIIKSPGVTFRTNSVFDWRRYSIGGFIGSSLSAVVMRLVLIREKRCAP